MINAPKSPERSPRAMKKDLNRTSDYKSDDEKLTNPVGCSMSSLNIKIVVGESE